MRSMKFKIIFVTTCFALNIGYLLADPTLLFDITFDTVEDRETYLKSQGIHDIDTFDPVKRFVGISAKSTVASALPYFSEGTTSSDWTMVKMASDKKYIELAPGTEIYIKNNVSYEFKGIDELVVPSKLPVNEQKTAGVQSAAVQKAEPVKEEKPNEDKSAQTVVDVKDNKPDMSGEKKVDPAAAKTEDDAKDDKKPNEIPGKTPESQHGIGDNQKTKEVVKDERTLNVIKIARTERLDYINDPKALRCANNWRYIMNPYLETLDDFSIGEIANLLIDLRKDNKLCFDRITKNLYDKYKDRIKLFELKNVGVQGNVGIMHTTLLKYFENIKPKTNRFLRSGGLYKFNNNEAYGSLFYCAPEAFLQCFTIDDVEDYFKGSIRRTCNAFSDINSKHVFNAVNPLIGILGNVVLANIIEEFKCNIDNKIKIQDSLLRLRQTKGVLDIFNIQKNILVLSKADRTKNVFMDKANRLSAVSKKMAIRLENLREKSNKTFFSDVSVMTETFENSKKDMHINFDLLPAFISAFYQHGSANDLVKRYNDKDNEQLSIEGLLLRAYFDKFDFKSKNVNDNAVDSEKENIQQNPYKDIKTFYKALSYKDVMLTVTDENVSEVLKLLTDNSFVKEIEGAGVSKDQRDKFTDFYMRILDYKSTDTNIKDVIIEFEKCVKKNAGKLLSSKIQNKLFDSLDYFEIITKNQFINIISREGKFEFTVNEIKDEQKELWYGALTLFADEKFLDVVGDILRHGKQNMVSSYVFDILCKIANDYVVKNKLPKTGADVDKNRLEELQSRINVNTIIAFNKMLVEHGIVALGSVTTNEYLDFFID